MHAVGHAVDAAVGGCFMQAGDGEIAVHIVKIGGVLIVMVLPAIELINRRIGGDRVYIAVK